MQESITLTGVGGSEFANAVEAVQYINQAFAMYVNGLQCRMREWKTSEREDYTVLTFANRYLTQARNVAGEEPVSLADTVDPFNILRPLLQGRSERHIPENVVEHWERLVGIGENGSK